MTNSVDLEQALTRYKRAREALRRADDCDFDRYLREFVRELHGNALTSAVAQALPPTNAQSWWIETLERAEKSYAPASLDFPDAEDDRLALFAGLLASMAEQGCTVRDFGTVLHCYKLDEAAAMVRELVVEPFCELLETRLAALHVLTSPAQGERALDEAEDARAIS